jgi:hypothetical protein
MMNIAVVHKMARRHEIDSVSPGEGDATFARIPNIAALNAACLSAVDGNGSGAQIINSAPLYSELGCVSHADPIAPRISEINSPDAYLSPAFDADERLIEFRDSVRRLGRVT